MTNGTLAVALGAALKSARLAAGVSQRGKARELGVAGVTLREVEEGLANPTLRRVEDLAAAYGVTITITTTTPRKARR